jgi:hypothetical protein
VAQTPAIVEDDLVQDVDKAGDAIQDDLGCNTNGSGVAQWLYPHMPKQSPLPHYLSPDSASYVLSHTLSSPVLAGGLANLDLVTAQLQYLMDAIKTLSSPTPSPAPPVDSPSSSGSPSFGFLCSTMSWNEVLCLLHHDSASLPVG